MTEPVPLTIAPGIVKDFTPYTAKGAWIDGDKVRFVSGYPQSIGGWVKAVNTTILGIPRSVFAYNDLTGDANMSVGTNLKYYVERGGGYRDVTPIRRSLTLGSNPIATTNGSPVITITDTGHGAAAGDYVTFSGATAVGGLTTGTLNAEYPIAAIIDANSYTVNVGVNASSTTTGGGAAVVAAYQIAVAGDSIITGGGWGAGTWGRSTWGSSTSTTSFGVAMRVWTHDNWGNLLIFAPRGGQIYQYDPAAPARGVLVSSLGGASNVPTVVDAISVATDQRIMIAFGCNPLGSSVADPLQIRWSDRNTTSPTNWTPGPTTTAGDARLTLGSQLFCVVKTKSEHVVFTDRAVYSFRFVGGNDVFAPVLLGDKISTVGPFAAGAVDQTVYWMGQRGFFCYDGRIKRLECPLENWLDKRIDKNALPRVHCAPNSKMGEVWWFYQKEGDTQTNDYIIYNYKENVWSIGTLTRTCWLDQGVYNIPRAFDATGQCWAHETGMNADASALVSFIKSGDTDMDAGKKAMFMKSIWPDIDFMESTSGTASVGVIMTFKNRPGSTPHATSNSTVVETTATTYTDRLDIGKRGRTASIEIRNTQANVEWRLGTPRAIIRPDGSR